MKTNLRYSNICLRALALLCLMMASVGAWAQTRDGYYKYYNRGNTACYLSVSNNNYNGNAATPYLCTSNANDKTGDEAIWAVYSYNGSKILVHATDGRIIVTHDATAGAHKVHLESVNVANNNDILFTQTTSGNNPRYYWFRPNASAANTYLNPYGGNPNDIGLWTSTDDNGNQWRRTTVSVAPTIVAPTISSSNRGRTVTLACTNTYARIYYTTDGNNPTTSSTRYTGSFNITETKTIKARAYVGFIKADGTFEVVSQSNVTTQQVEVLTTPTTLTFANASPTITADGWGIQLPAVTLKANETTVTGRTITYSGTGCTVNNNGTVTGLQDAGATITASFAGDADYDASSATYIITGTNHDALNETIIGSIAITPATADLDLDGTQEYSIPASVTDTTRTCEQYKEFACPTGAFYSYASNNNWQYTLTKPTVLENTRATVNLSRVDWSYSGGQGQYFQPTATNNKVTLTRTDQKTDHNQVFTITANATYGSADKTATAKVTILKTVVDITHLYSGNDINLHSGEAENIAGHFSWQPNSESDGETYKNFTYTSANTSVATVDNKGRVTAVGIGSTTITVQSIKIDGETNTGVSCAITVNVTMPKLPTPEIWIVGNEVSFYCAEAGATFYYTTNGATPTTGSTQWDGATLTNIANNTTIKVIAVKNGFATSDVATKVKYAPSVVYIDGTNGNDANDGYTYNRRVKTIARAYNQLLGNSIDNNIIVVCGTINPTNAGFQCDANKPCTFTGMYDGIDRGGIIRLPDLNDGNVANPPTSRTHNYVSADTRFRYLTFRNQSNTQGNAFFMCRGYDVTFDVGIQMDMANIRQLSADHGNLDNAYVPEISILLTESNGAKPNDAQWERTKPQVVTFRSGHYGRILGGRYTSGFFHNNGSTANTSHAIMATKNNPVWAIINVEIDKDNVQRSNNRDYTYDINSICTGLTDGSFYGDVVINVKGGKLGYIVGANQGNSVRSGGTSGAGTWPNSSFFGRVVINVDPDENFAPVVINNIFAGGLGRRATNNAGVICDMFIYGKTEVNVKGGTIKQSVYGAGAGGVMGLTPWDPHIPYHTDQANNNNPTYQNAIFNGVRYGGAAGELASVNLHTLNADHTGFADSGRESLNLANTSTTINISGGSIGQNVYGGGYGYVDGGVLPYQITPQGVGSLFGTSNINITGGTITGNVYGGSRGSAEYYGKTNNYGDVITHIAELNGTINMNITGTDSKYPTIGGDIFGAGAGVTSAATNDNHKRIATAGNTDLGNQYTTDVHININMPTSHPLPGNVYGGGQLGLLDGSAKIEIVDGKVSKDVFGGGKSADVSGTTVVTLTDGSVRNIYGGGEAANINKLGTSGGTTSINMNGGTVTKSIYGGGLGNTTNVVTSTTVSANGGTVTEDVYGGSGFGKVGMTTVTINNGATVGQDVFGGGFGQKAGGGNPAYEADVAGDASVTINPGARITGDVFGGNNAAGAPQGAVNVVVNGTSELQIRNVYGGGNEAAYSGTPLLTVNGCSAIINDLYGGGNAASTGGTNAVVNGGTIARAFGGGNGESGTAADVNGNSSLIIHGGSISQVFGGSNSNGIVSGTMTLEIDHTSACEEIITDVYGGGNMAPGKVAELTIGCGAGPFVNVFGGSNNADVSGNIVLNITGGTITNVFGGNNTGGDISGNVTVNVSGGHLTNVFGENNAGGNVTGKVTVNIEQNDLEDCEHLTLDYVYGGGKDAAYTPTTPGAYPEVNLIKGVVNHDVFGGGLGSGATVTSNPTVNMRPADKEDFTVKGNIYGGGSAAPVDGSTTLTISNGTIGSTSPEGGYVFGGGLGQTAVVSGNTRVQVTGNTDVEKNVYGGGNGGEVEGDTKVIIGE